MTTYKKLLYVVTGSTQAADAPLVRATHVLKTSSIDGGVDSVGAFWCRKLFRCDSTHVYYNLVVGRPNSTINHNT